MKVAQADMKAGQDEMKAVQALTKWETNDGHKS